MIRAKENELKEMYAQYDDAEYEIDEPLKAEETEVKAAACQPVANKPIAKPRMIPASCRQHEKLNCSQCLNIAVPAHHRQALVAVCQECGLHHPVIADAYQSQDKLSLIHI